MRLAAGRIGERNALHDEASGAGRPRRRDQIARAFDADARVARIRCGQRLLVEALRQVGQLVNNDLRLRVNGGTLERGGFVHVNDCGTHARSFQFARRIGRARRAGHIVPGRDEKWHQPPSDGAARSSKKNAHVDLPFRSQYSGTRDKPPAPHTPHTPTREPRSNPIVGISRIGNRVAMMIGRNAARVVAVTSHSAPQISDTTTVDA